MQSTSFILSCAYVYRMVKPEHCVLIYTFQKKQKQKNPQFKIFSVYNKLNQCSLALQERNTCFHSCTVFYPSYKYVFTVLQHIIVLKSAFNININSHILKALHTKFSGKRQPGRATYLSPLRLISVTGQQVGPTRGREGEDLMPGSAQTKLYSKHHLCP